MCLENLIKYSKKYDNIGFLAPFIYRVTNNKYQLYHHKKISKYKNKNIQYIQKYDNAKNIDIKVNPVTSEEFKRPAPRPAYSVLDNFMLKLVGLNSFRNWEEALVEYLEGEV